MTKNGQRRWACIKLLALLMVAMWGLAAAKLLSVPIACIIVGAAGFSLLLPIRRRRTLLDWIAVTTSFIVRHRRAVGFTPESAIAAVGPNAIGVRHAGRTLVTALEVAPTLAVTIGGVQGTATDDVLPVRLVAQCMRQYGLELGIDIISTGARVVPGSAFGAEYSELVGRMPLVGRRRTWLVLRLDIIDNLVGIVARGPSRTAAPRALAVAAERVAQRLRQQGLRAHTLSDKQLDAVLESLLQPLYPDRIRERWSAMRTANAYAATYVADPAQLTDSQLGRWWAWPSDNTLVAIKLFGPDDPHVTALVRYVTPRRIRSRRLRKDPGALRLTTGTQRKALKAALPVPDRNLPADAIISRLADLDPLHVPIGPAGQIIGTMGNAPVALPLCDHSGFPKRLRIDARIQLSLARELVLRAVATGTVVSIHADDPSRWDGLIDAVNRHDLLFFATAGAKRSGIALFDGKSVTAVPAHTVMALRSPDDSPPDDRAELTFVQKDAAVVEIMVAGNHPFEVISGPNAQHDELLNPSPKNPHPRTPQGTQEVGDNAMPPGRVSATAPQIRICKISGRRRSTCPWALIHS